MKKVFRANSNMTVEKQFIADDAPVPAGWYADIKAALKEWKDGLQEEAPQAPQEVTAPRRGRPRKE